MRALQVKLDAVARNVKERRSGTGVADHLAAVGECLAQVRSRGAFRHVRPEQTHDFITRVGAVALVSKKGQQCARLMINKPLNGLVVKADEGWSQEGQCESWH